MKTTTCFLIILLLAGMTANFATAQKDSNELLSGTNASIQPIVAEPADKIASPVIERPVNTPLVCMNGESKVIKLNYALPSFTYSAILLIQDFTGRTLKTFNVDIHNANTNEYYVNDLLSGTYNYTLVLDHQKKVTGELIVKE